MLLPWLAKLKPSKWSGVLVYDFSRWSKVFACLIQHPTQVSERLGCLVQEFSNHTISATKSTRQSGPAHIACPRDALAAAGAPRRSAHSAVTLGQAWGGSPREGCGARAVGRVNQALGVKEIDTGVLLSTSR